MKKQKQKFKTIKILESDYKKIRKWAFIREMKIYEVIALLTKKK